MSRFEEEAKEQMIVAMREEIARLKERVAELEKVAKYAIECDEARKSPVPVSSYLVWKSRQVEAIAKKSRAALREKWIENEP